MSCSIEDLTSRYPVLEVCKHDVVKACTLLLQAIKKGNKFLMCGNGGSAADCDHWCAELLKGFKHKRPISNWPEIQGSIPAIPLTQFSALATAWANDCNADWVYAQLTSALSKEGDVLIGISTSGNAHNVINAFQIARAMGVKTVSLTGRDGGILAKMADVDIKVPEDETYKVQELHLPVYHFISLYLEHALFQHKHTYQ